MPAGARGEAALEKANVLQAFRDVDGTLVGFYSPKEGAPFPALPPAPVLINHPSGRFYYSGGVWYAPRGPRFVAPRRFRLLHPRRTFSAASIAERFLSYARR